MTSPWPNRLLGAAAVTTALALAAVAASTGPVLAAPPETIVTEPVSDGIVRVVGDGVRPLAPTPNDGGLELEIGPDGTVWLFRADDFFEVGVERTYPREGPLTAFDVHPRITADGSPWVLSERALWRLDDGTWSLGRRQARGSIEAFDVGPDGSVWSIWSSNTGHAPYGGAGRLEGDAWTDIPLDDEVADALAIDPSVAMGGPGLAQMRAGPNGTVSTLWQGGVPDGRQVSALLTSSGAGWTTLDPFGGRPGIVATRFDIGADGTTWVLGTSTVDPTSGDVTYHLVRGSGGAWHDVELPDGLVPDGRLEAAPDGALWLSSPLYVERGHVYEEDCDGVWSSDGDRWTHQLAGVCIVDLDVAPDGRVWVVEGAMPDDEEGRFGATAIDLITPIDG
jgi:hypothetical protein